MSCLTPRRLTAVLAVAAVLGLGAVPAAAQPWGRTAPAAVEPGLLARVWHWLGALWSPGAETPAPSKAQSAGTATSPAPEPGTVTPDAGLRMDPNG